MKIIKLTEEQIKKVVQEVLKENEKHESNYMFFSNLEQIKRQCELLLNLDQDMVNQMLDNGHDWADDHVSSAKENMDQVFDFFMNETKKDDTNEAKNMAQQAAIAINMKKKGIEPKEETMMNEEEEIDEAKHKPTNPKLWSQCLAWARSKYKVCPSAYCNGAAAKRYKSKGGGWRTTKK